jgi:hypothetical protein
MRTTLTTYRDGKKRIRWGLVAAAVAGVYVGVIGAAELFWVGITGAFSPLIGLYALMAASLVTVRIVGGVLAKPADLIKAEAGAV